VDSFFGHLEHYIPTTLEAETLALSDPMRKQAADASRTAEAGMGSGSMTDLTSTDDPRVFILTVHGWDANEEYRPVSIPVTPSFLAILMREMAQKSQPVICPPIGIEGE
jgi:hypothetical protein